MCVCVCTYVLLSVCMMFICLYVPRFCHICISIACFGTIINGEI